MPWTPRQKRYLLSSGSPLSGQQKEKMLSELHADPSLGHKKKGSEAMHKAPKHTIHEMRIEVHRGEGGKVTGHTVHHHMMPSKASKSGAFMEHTHHSFPFGADGHSSTHGHMLDHIGEHLKIGGEAMDHAAKAESDVGAVDDGRDEG